MEVLRLSGKDPKSIGLGVFDDSRIFDFLDWPIVTARQPIEKMGTYAAKMLLSIINGMMPEEKLKYFDVEIVLR